MQLTPSLTCTASKPRRDWSDEYTYYDARPLLKMEREVICSSREKTTWTRLHYEAHLRVVQNRVIEDQMWIWVGLYSCAHTHIQ